MGMEDEKKQDAGADEGFLKTAAEAVGATLGKLAVRTGLARPSVPVKRKKAVSPPKTKGAAKKTQAVRKNAVKPAVKHRAPPRKKRSK
jgi:hypothetical protein